MTAISISPKDSVSSTRPVQPTDSAPRVSPEPVESMRADWLATLARIPGDGLKGDGFPRNVLGTIMHNPDTVGTFLEYWVTCKERMSLSVREQEIVILRMAVLYASDYVWKHHVPVGREFGIDETEFSAIRAGDIDGFASAREQALFALVDELVEQRTIRREVWARHATTLATIDIVDLVALVSQYVLFALMNNAFQVAIEPTLAEVPSLRD
jgi:4-carboxymuconolactone decarboxylase